MNHRPTWVDPLIQQILNSPGVQSVRVERINHEQEALLMIFRSPSPVKEIEEADNA